MAKEIDSIDNFGRFFEMFRTLDKDGDGSISVQESKSDVDRYDADHNGSVEVWELAKAVQKNQTFFGISGLSLFNNKMIERLKKTTNKLSGIEATFFIEETDFTKEQKESLNKDISRGIRDDTLYSTEIAYLEGVVATAEHLNKAGYTNDEAFALLEKTNENLYSPSSNGYFMKYKFAKFFDALKEEGVGKTEMTELLPKLTGIHGIREDPENAIPVVSALRKEGYRTDEIIRLLARTSGYQYSNFCEYFLSIAETMKKAGFMNSQRDTILIAIADKAKWHADLAYQRLPDLIDSLRGTFSPVEIGQLLTNTASDFAENEEEIGKAYEFLVPMIEALSLSNFKPEEMIRIIPTTCLST